MSDLTAVELAVHVVQRLTHWLPGCRYVEAIGEVRHRISQVAISPDGSAALDVEVRQESEGNDEYPQVFRVRVHVTETTPQPCGVWPQGMEDPR